MTQIINTGFDNNNVGQAAAMTVIFMLIITVIAIIQRAAVRQRGGVDDAVQDHGADPAIQQHETYAALATAFHYLILTVVALFFFLPVYYLIVGSFRPSSEVLSGLSGFVPTNLSFDNYAGVFDHLSFMPPATSASSPLYRSSATTAVVAVPDRELHGGLLVREDEVARQKGAVPAGDHPDDHPVRSRCSSLDSHVSAADTIATQDSCS